MERKCRICGGPLDRMNDYTDSHAPGFILCEWCYRNIPGGIIMVASRERIHWSDGNQVYDYDSYDKHPKVIERMGMLVPEGNSKLPHFRVDQFEAAIRAFWEHFPETYINRLVVSRKQFDRCCADLAVIGLMKDSAISFEYSDSSITVPNNSSITVYNDLGQAHTYMFPKEAGFEEEEKPKPAFQTYEDSVPEEDREKSSRMQYTHVPVFETKEGDLLIVPPPSRDNGWRKGKTTRHHPSLYLMGGDFHEETKTIFLQLAGIENVSITEDPSPEPVDVDFCITHENGVIELQEWLNKAIAQQLRCVYFEKWGRRMPTAMQRADRNFPGYYNGEAPQHRTMLSDGWAQKKPVGQWHNRHPSGPIKREEK